MNKSLLFTTLIILTTYAYLYIATDIKPLNPNPYDSYTLQAAAWWQKSLSLPHDYPWLELANYQNKYFVSFPPIPSLVSFALIPFVGDKVPSNLLVTLYIIASFFFAVLIGRRFKLNYPSSIFWAFFLVFASNILTESIFGGVWFQAQTLSFLLSIASLYFITLDKKWGWILGLTMLGLAIGCRPFQIIFIPLYLWLISNKIIENKKDSSYHELFIEVIFCMIGLLIVGFALAGYNYARFGNPFEFGHNYLPEFSQYSQFGIHYMKQNFANIMRLPKLNPDFTISFPTSNGFSFYLVNSLYLALLWRIILFFKKLTIEHYLIFLSVLLNIALILTHATMGGYQFGARYLVDALPFVFYFVITLRPKISSIDIILAFIGFASNIYGTIWLYKNW